MGKNKKSQVSFCLFLLIRHEESSQNQKVTIGCEMIKYIWTRRKYRVALR